MMDLITLDIINFCLGCEIDWEAWGAIGQILAAILTAFLIWYTWKTHQDLTTLKLSLNLTSAGVGGFPRINLIAHISNRRLIPTYIKDFGVYFPDSKKFKACDRSKFPIPLPSVMQGFGGCEFHVNSSLVTDEMIKEDYSQGREPEFCFYVETESGHVFKSNCNAYEKWKSISVGS